MVHAVLHSQCDETDGTSMKGHRSDGREIAACMEAKGGCRVKQSLVCDSTSTPGQSLKPGPHY